MNRIDRLQAIIVQLQSKKVVTAQELADYFDTSTRTIYRDIRALEQAGVPIGAEAGYGYFIDFSYHLPPVRLTNDEASALLVGSKFSSHFTDHKISASFRSALSKIKAVLGPESRSWVNDLDSSIKVFDAPSFCKGNDPGFLFEAQTALVKKTLVELTYFAQYKQATEKRFIEPISLVFYAANWHLIAWCRLRKDFRDFRLDRIQSFKITNEIYQRDLDKSFEEYLKKQKETISLFSIKIAYPKALFLRLGDSKYWYGFINVEFSDETAIMYFVNPALEGFAKWLLTLEPCVEVIEPVELRTEFYSLLKNLLDNYSLIR